MECEYCDYFTGVCINEQCPLCADCCPVPETAGICKYERREERKLSLTPKGCAVAALVEAGIINNSEILAIDQFWERFSELMERNGYVTAEH